MDEDRFIDAHGSTSKDKNSLSSVKMRRSELAQEIISRKDGFLEKWSLLIFLSILLLVFAGTWFIHYPDVVTTSAVFAAENNPQKIIVKQEGHMAKLFVRNDKLVKQKDMIAWIESSADHNEVNELAKNVDECISFLSENQPQKIESTFNVNLNNLGELQSDYAQFLIAESTFNSYISNAANLAKAQSEHIPDRAKIAFQQQLQLLKSKISNWNNRYILRAPITGKISIEKNFKEGDYLKGGTLFGYITPKNNRYFMETILPQYNFGKIDTGMHVQMRLDAYPYEEWGFLNGTISYISSVPSENGFLATIRLDNGLITNNQKKVIFRSGLRAQAIIITKDMRLLQKFYYSLVKSTSVHK